MKSAPPEPSILLAVRPRAILTHRITAHLNAYTCQVNVIDELGRKFSFPRTLVFVIGEGLN